MKQRVHSQMTAEVGDRAYQQTALVRLKRSADLRHEAWAWP
jgi:hypothetical protein